MALRKGKKKEITKGRRWEIPSGLVSFVIILFILFILGGGVYDLVLRPDSIIRTSRGYSAIGDPETQSITESIVSMILYGLCFTGVFLVYRSTKVLYDRSRANAFLVVGLILAIIGYLGLHYLLLLKTS